MRLYAIVIILTLVTLSAGVTAAQSSDAKSIAFVYRIKIANCDFEPEFRRQTGFRVQGVSGIVTALHGIADCDTISANNDDYEEVHDDLVIKEVDIARDIALLSSPDMENMSATDGLIPSNATYDHTSRNNLRVVGYPLGIDKQDVESTMVIRDIETLDDVIPNEEETNEFLKRRSPDIDINVLNVEGHLVPGHSGAPILDSDGQVIGVGDGGLKGGAVNRSWAIPWIDVRLQPIDDAEVKGRYEKIRNSNYAVELSFSSTTQTTITVGTATSQYAGRVIDSDSERPISNAEITLVYGQHYAIEITDSEGFFGLHYPSDAIEAQVLIEATGYEPYNRKIDLTQNGQSTIFQIPRLEPQSDDILLRPGDYAKVVARGGLDIYQGRSTAHGASHHLSQYHIVYVERGPRTEENNYWWEVRVIDGNLTGWLAPGNPQEPVVQRLANIGQGTYVQVIAYEPQKFYSLPGIRNEYTTVQPYTQLVVISTHSEEKDGMVWWKVQDLADGKVGWLPSADLHGAYLDPVSPPPPPSAATAPLTATLTTTPTATVNSGCTVIVSSLNMRSGPGLTCSVLRTLRGNSIIKPLARNLAGTWLNVEVDGAEGWISGNASYVECTTSLDDLPVTEQNLQCPPPPPPPTPRSTSTVIEPFEGTTSLIWFTFDALPIIGFETTSERSFGGSESLKVEYAKTDTYQFVGAELPSTVRDLSTTNIVQMRVFGRESIHFKLEDESGRGVDVATADATDPNGWSLLRFAINTDKVKNAVDLSHIKVMFFFPAPGDPTASGVIYFDDITLVK